jgi:hypothetical protein
MMKQRLREYLRTPSSYGALAAHAVIAICLALCAVCELWFIEVDRPLGFDEGYIGALALRLLDGGMLPGVDGVGQRGPVFYWLAAIAQAVFGRFHWFGFRYVTWLAASIVVVSLLGLGLLCRRPLAGAIGAAFYVWMCFYYYDLGTGFAMNGEQVIAPMLTGAALLTATALRARTARRRVALVALAGLLAGLAGWTKVTLLLAIGPLALWVVAVALAAELPPRMLAHTFGALIAGWLLPVGGVALLYAAVGHFDDLIYRFFTYNRDVHMGVYADQALAPEIGQWFVTDPPPALGWLLCTCVLIGYAGYLHGAHRARALRAALLASDILAAVLLFSMIAFASGMIQMRFWGHHFIAALPWAGFVAGLAITAPLHALRGRAYATASLCVALVLIVGLGRSVGYNAWQRTQDGRAMTRKPPIRDPMCKHIHRYAGKDDPIFVWGWDGDLHVSCARRVATRFVYTTMLAGVVPPFWNEAHKARVARDAPAQAAHDLGTSKPPLVLDMPAKLGGIRITAIPELRRILKKDYCKLEDVIGGDGRRATFYGRKDRGHCSAPAEPGASAKAQRGRAATSSR